jgi:hypothetical protein
VRQSTGRANLLTILRVEMRVLSRQLADNQGKAQGRAETLTHGEFFVNTIHDEFVTYGFGKQIEGERKLRRKMTTKVYAIGKPWADVGLESPCF